MRPALKSGLLPVWRDRDTLQIGIDPRRAIALSGMGQAAFLIGLLDGSRDRDQVIAAAAGQGIPIEATERVLTLLAAGGALDDFPASTLRALPAPLRAKLAPELATTSLAHRDGDGGARALARRRAAVVRIEGDRRIGRAVARILSASGVRHVQFVRAPTGSPAGGNSAGRPGATAIGPGATSHPATNLGAASQTATRPGSSSRAATGPGAARQTATSTGAPRRAATRPDDTSRTTTSASAISRAATGPGATSRIAASAALRPGSDTTARQRAIRVSRPAHPDLVILVGCRPAELAEQLTRDGVPHLAVMAGEAIGIVGPLVVPGKTTCLRCLDYVRAGNDPAWPLILAQIARRRPVPPACDAVLAAMVAAQAAAQALTAIEQAPIASPAANGTLELVLPDWRWRRRTWQPHPACVCATHTVR